MEIEQRRVRPHRAGETEGAAGDQPHPQTALGDDGQRLRPVVVEGRRTLFLGLRQRHPALDHLEGAPGLRRRDRKSACRERVCQYVSISVVAGSLNKKSTESLRSYTNHYIQNYTTIAY